MLEKIKEKWKRIQDINDIATYDSDNMNLNEFTRWSLHHASKAAVVLGIIGLPLVPVMGLAYFLLKEPEHSNKKPAIETQISATQARIDRDELADIILNIDDQIIPLLAESTNGAINYRPLTSADIYRIK